LFSDDLKDDRGVTNVEDSKLFQCEAHTVQKWCLDNAMKLIASKTTFIRILHPSSQQTR
jgi:hypothetical protein